MSHLSIAGAENGVYWNAADLMTRTFPEPKWAVHGLIPEGLTLLAGSPKLGKSWMCMGLAFECATGGRALGSIPVAGGPALYCALEDTPRRLQDRLGQLLGDESPPDHLAFVTVLPRMPVATDLIDGWLTDHPGARLVVVDVLRKIRPPEGPQSNTYNADYEVMSQLKRLADRHGVAVVVVHHTRKAVDEGDVFNEVSGSTGLTGAADTIMIIKKARNTAEAVLHFTGRDITEGALGLSWSSDTCKWSLSEEPAEVLTQSNTRRRITAHLSEHPGRRPAEVAEALNLTHDNAKQSMRRMAKSGQLDSDGDGGYFVAVSPVTAVTVSPLLGDSSDSGDTSIREVS